MNMVVKKCALVGMQAGFRCRAGGNLEASNEDLLKRPQHSYMPSNMPSLHGSYTQTVFIDCVV